MVIASIMLLTFIGAAWATSPRREVVLAVSRNLKIEAISDPSMNTTTVYRLNPDHSAGDMLWKFPKWLSSFAVADDGSAIVAQERYLPLNARDDDVVLTFIVRGKLAREITVKQLLGSYSNLQKVSTPLSDSAIRSFKSKAKKSKTPQMYPRLDVSPSSDGRLRWGQGVYGIDQNGFACVDTIIGFFVFDVQTARCVFPPKNHID
jgi:hypothetical protein